MNTDALTNRVVERLERLKSDIIGQIEGQNIKASGRTQRTFVVEQYAGGVRLVAKGGERAPIPTLEIGRPAGRVPKNFTEIIFQWSKDKNLSWGDDKERKKIAGAVAWGKIRKKGTDRHKNHADVYSTLVKQAAQDINGIIMAETAEIIKSNF